MDKSIIIDRVREYEPELKEAGIEHPLLHGSYAAGQRFAIHRMWT